MRLIVSTLLIVISVFVLESARSGVEVTHVRLGETPVTAYARAGADGPVIVIAHGFAGSSQMMQGYALPLAQAGYRVFAFDFLGHGRHRVPMSGDVNAIEGTTRLLVAQTLAVIEAVAEEGTPVGLLGHSMATDILVRVADEIDTPGPLVLLSAFSQEITGAHPDNLLLLVGAWEPGLRAFALQALGMVDPEAVAGQTLAGGDVTRRAVVLPMIEHVSILQSRAGQREALAWFNAGFEEQGTARIWPMGPAIVGLLIGLVVLFVGLSRRLPRLRMPELDLSVRQRALVVLLPMVATPPLGMILNPGLMPVLVADYLAVHLLVYGLIQLGLLVFWRARFGAVSALGFVWLIAGCAVFAVALDRYAANFWPTGERLWIIAAIALGAIAYFVADARLCHRASRGFRWLSRLAFLASLIIAVMIDFAGLFFLLMIAPVIVLFYLVFGTMGRAVSHRTGPLATGLALGLMLAWSLGVSFPLFQG
ncbi:alpha/beta hydrolase [Yoonia sp.]|uniref:alpha/beta hydrolase n=1 Tax=Yoonia sp. TaxID=2212373 RepID=UPI002FDB2C35